MGSIIYGHLNDSVLLDGRLIEAQYRGLSDVQLGAALQEYRDFCIARLDELLEEVAPQEGRLRLFVGEDVDERILRQGAFYLDTVIMADPLFKFTWREDEMASALSSSFGMARDVSLDRNGIAEAAKELLSCRPLVDAGYVRFFPTSLESEQPKDLPLYTSDDGFEGVLPPDLLKLYKDAAEIRSVVPSPHGLLVMSELKLGRRISVDFDSLMYGGSFAFDLREQEVISWDRETGRLQLAMRIPDSPPSQGHFDAWVNSSVNRAAAMHFTSLSRDIKNSVRFGSQYMTRSRFAASVLESSACASSHSIQQATTNGWLNLELPIFDSVSIEKLMEARSDEDAFRRFRLHLEKHFRELRLEADPEKRRLKTENAMHELVEIQRSEIDSAIQRLKRKGLLAGLGTVASMAAATVTSGTSLIAALCAGYAGYKTIEEYRIATKESPAYFLWNVMKQK